MYSGIVVKPYWGFKVGEKIYISETNLTFTKKCVNIYKTEDLSSFVATTWDFETLQERVKFNSPIKTQF